MPLTLPQVMQLHTQRILENLRTARPAKVVSYDAEKQTADVQPLVKNVVVRDGVAEEIVESLPQIQNVPVVFPRAGEFFVSFPMAAGDTVLLVTCEQSIDQWREKDKEVDPGLAHRHHLGDSVAIPGLFATPRALSDAHASNMVIGKSGGPQIHIKPNGEIHLYAENATDFVALAQLVLVEHQNILTQFTALLAAITSAASTEAGAGGIGGMTALLAQLVPAPLPPVWPSWVPASVAATKVKAT